MDRLGSLKKVQKEKRRQKEVDNLIAVDTVYMAYEDHYDIALLLGADEDHLPVVEAVKRTGKRVYGAFFNEHITQDLRNAFDIPFALTEYWLTNIKRKVSIIEFKIPDKIKKGEEVSVSVKIRGTVEGGFLDVLIVDAEERKENYPDPA